MSYDYFEHFEKFEAKPMLMPIPGMEPAQVSIEYREKEGGPSALQLELLERIRPEFARLWSEALSEMQKDWGESIPILYDPIEAFWMVGILIPVWQDRRMDSEKLAPLEPSVENFYWEMFCGPAFPDCSGCHSEFVGVQYEGTVLHW